MPDLVPAPGLPPAPRSKATMAKAPTAMTPVAMAPGIHWQLGTYTQSWHLPYCFDLLKLLRSAGAVFWAGVEARFWWFTWFLAVTVKCVATHTLIIVTKSCRGQESICSNARLQLTFSLCQLWLFYSSFLWNFWSIPNLIYLLSILEGIDEFYVPQGAKITKPQ